MDDLTYTEQEFLNPDWSTFEKCNDWRNYISDEMRAMWDTFTREQKLAIGKNAESQADLEEWE